MDRLAEWLRRKREETEYSFPQIARRSGGLVSQGTAANVVNKRYEHVDAKTVRGLAKAFEITEQELWDIVNGVIPLVSQPTYERRDIALPSPLWRLIDSEAKRGKRNWDQFLEAILTGYFGADVNIDLDRLREIRNADALIIPLDEGGRGELPFTTDTDSQAKRRSVKQLSKKARSS